MHATRFNGFAMIHKALRSMLYDCANTIQQTDFADTEAMSPVLLKIENIIQFFDAHAGHEDTYVLRIAATANPTLAASFGEEHVTDRQLGVNLHSAIQAYRSSADSIERVRTGHRIFYAFNAFIAFNLTHMNKEENELNEVLWSQLSDAEIMGVNSRIAAAAPPAQAIQNFSWMMRSCNNPEIIGLLKSLQANAPVPVVNMVMSIAEQELSAPRLAMIQEALSMQEAGLA